MISEIKRLLVIVSLASVPFAAGSCAGNPPHVNDVQQLSQRLQGVWLLRSYRPNVSLDPPLLALTNVQFGQMRVTINSNRLIAQGPGLLQVVRTYQIQEIVDQSATLVITEPTGESTRVWVEFRDNLLTFRPMDPPWTGEGTLQRI